MWAGVGGKVVVVGEGWYSTAGEWVGEGVGGRLDK